MTGYKNSTGVFLKQSWGGGSPLLNTALPNSAAIYLGIFYNVNMGEIWRFLHQQHTISFSLRMSAEISVCRGKVENQYWITLRWQRIENTYCLWKQFVTKLSRLQSWLVTHLEWLMRYETNNRTWGALELLKSQNPSTLINHFSNSYRVMLKEELKHHAGRHDFEKPFQTLRWHPNLSVDMIHVYIPFWKWVCTNEQLMRIQIELVLSHCSDLSDVQLWC